MRVGLIGYALDRPITGIGRYTVELVRAITALENSPAVTLLAAGGEGPLADHARLNRVRMPGCRLLPGLLTIGSALVLSRARRLELDVVHDPIGVAPFLLGTGGANAVVTIHDVIPWSFPGHSTRLEDLVYRFWLPRIVSNGDQMILTPSQQSRQDICKFLQVPEHRIRVIPYGVSTHFRVLPPEIVAAHLQQRFGFTAPYVLCVGALTERKNLARAVQAFCQVAEEYSDLRLVLAGPHVRSESQLLATVEKSPLASRIVVTGPVFDADLVTLYNGAQVLLFPSLYEGFGLPLLEAMACGTPVIAGNGSSLPEVVGEAGILVNPYNVGAIASALHQVLSDHELAAKMRTRGLIHASCYTWKRTALETVAAYEQAARGSTV